MTAPKARDDDPHVVPASRGAIRPGLTREEEVELAAHAAAGDRGARDRMIEANIGLVHAIARDFRGRGAELQDLVAEGRLGLFRAAESFDPRLGARFSTYATYWIREAIGRALIDTAPMIRLPVNVARLLTRWRRRERALAREMGREPAFDEVASSLGLSEAEEAAVSRAERAAGLRPESDCEETAEGSLLTKMVDDRSAEGPLDAEDERAVTLRRLDRLYELERVVVAWRHGVSGDPIALAEIGRRLGMAPGDVRRLELQSLRKLRCG